MHISAASSPSVVPTVTWQVPFRPPFNTSAVYSDSRLLTILTDFLKEQFKVSPLELEPGTRGVMLLASCDRAFYVGCSHLAIALFMWAERPPVLGPLVGFLIWQLELMTIITSPPGSKHQRWHQGWRYLFHPEERLPPYAVSLACRDLTGLDLT
jgi:hypothetical protein